MYSLVRSIINAQCGPSRFESSRERFAAANSQCRLAAKSVEQAASKGPLLTVWTPGRPSSPCYYGRCRLPKILHEYNYYKIDASFRNAPQQRVMNESSAMVYLNLTYFRFAGDICIITPSVKILIDV